MVEGTAWIHTQTLVASMTFLFETAKGQHGHDVYMKFNFS
jgi:hypothetical protein